MNLKIKALVHTVGLIAGTIAVSLGLNYIGNLLTRDQVGWILTSAIVGLFIYIVYSVNLSRLEHQEQLKKMNQSVSE
jgi:hypothetical protein